MTALPCRCGHPAGKHYLLEQFPNRPCAVRPCTCQRFIAVHPCCGNDPSNGHTATCDYRRIPIAANDEDTRTTRRHVGETRRLLTDVDARLVPVLEMLAVLTADGYPTAGTGRSGGVSDPTGRIATQRLERGPDARAGWAELWMQITGIAAELHGLANDLSIAIQRVPVTHHEPGQRCTGGLGLDGVDGWGDPTCQRHAVTRDGLCDACYQRRYRWQRREEVA